MATRPGRPTAFTVAAVVAFLVAAAMASQLVLTGMRVVRMSAWPTVPATIEQVELHRPGSATSRSLSVAARYRYVVDGKTYAGTRVSIYQPDSLGRFFQRTYDDLRGRFERHETVPAHVNPDSPSDAVLLPVWRTEVLAFQGVLVLLFSGAGLFALARARQAPNADAPTADADETDDGEPGVDLNERLPARAAWGRRIILVGLLLCAADYVLLERSRGDQYPFIDRLLASEVTARGTVFVSPPDERLPALVEQLPQRQSSGAALTVDTRAAESVTYALTLTAPDRDTALASLNTLRGAIHDAYLAQTGRDVSTFSSAYVAPVVTPTARILKLAIVGGLVVIGLLAVGVGFLMQRPARQA